MICKPLLNLEVPMTLETHTITLSHVLRLRDIRIHLCHVDDLITNELLYLCHIAYQIAMEPR